MARLPDTKGIPLQSLPGSSRNGRRYHPLIENTGKYGSVQECSWAIGFWTPFFMLAPYLLALVIAAIHLIIFYYLNGKYEVADNIPRQTYVTAGATIMATIFGFCVRTSLAVVFTQYFWRLVRLSPLNFGTVETLYTLRSNPLWGIQPAILHDGFLLVVVASIIWLVPIATSFPPSSMTLTNAPFTQMTMMDVPTFNASDTWGSNISTLQSNSLALINTSQEWGILPFTPKKDGQYAKASVSQLAINTLVNGRPQTAASPCGATCSYLVSIDAPYFRCNTTSIRKQAMQNNITEPNFSAHWGSGFSNTYNPDPKSGFQFTVLASDAITDYGDDNPMVYYTKDTSFCFVQRASYEILQNYTDNQLVSTPTLKSLHRFVDLQYGARPYSPGVNVTEWIYHPSSDWGPQVSRTVRDANLMTLAQAMASQLIGTYENRVLWDTGEKIDSSRDKCGWLYIDEEQGIYGYSNKTLIMNTPFFAGWDLELSQGKYFSRSLFDISEPKLNSMLLNITLSTIGKYNLWSTTANVTQHESRQQYNFSRPLSLILPYFITLGVTLPFLVLGLWALWWNGVPATDQGFLQILMTTRGSPTVDRLAARGCLGGDENVPADLKRLPVQFGEVMEGVDSDRELRQRSSAGRVDYQSDSSEAHLIRESIDDSRRGLPLASFGTPDEVKSLVRGKSYGVIH